MLVLVFGVLLMATFPIVVYSLRKTIPRWRTWTHVKATVTGTKNADDPRKQTVIKYRFVDERTGRTVTGRSDALFGRSNGRTVRVMYDAEDPDRNEMSAVALCVTMLVLCAAAAAVGVVLVAAELPA